MGYLQNSLTRYRAKHRPEASDLTFIMWAATVSIGLILMSVAFGVGIDPNASIPRPSVISNKRPRKDTAERRCRIRRQRGTWRHNLHKAELFRSGARGRVGPWALSISLFVVSAPKQAHMLSVP